MRPIESLEQRLITLVDRSNQMREVAKKEQEEETSAFAKWKENQADQALWEEWGRASERTGRATERWAEIDIQRCDVEGELETLRN